MTREQDDDALSWAGEENDPTLVPTHASAKPVAAPPVPVPVEADEAVDPDAPAADAAASSALLVTLGIAAGVYLLYTIGWVITFSRQSAQISTVATDVVGQFMYGLGLILAAAAPVLWFGGVLLLARKRRPGVRILLLVVGAVVLAPIPFVLGA